MDLRHPGSSDLVSHRVSVRLPVGASIDVTLTGEVRNAKAGPDGIVRLGIELAGLSETERSIVDLMDVWLGDQGKVLTFTLDPGVRGGRA